MFSIIKNLFGIQKEEAQPINRKRKEIDEITILSDDELPNNTKKNKIRDKMLIKNCRVWIWDEVGHFDSSSNYQSSGTGISGHPSDLCWFSVNKDGFIQTISHSTDPSDNSKQLPLPDEKEFDTVINAEGMLVLPGLIDSHIHVLLTGESSFHVDLSNCHSISDLKQKLKLHASLYPDLPWIIGVKWDQVSPLLLSLCSFLD